MVGFAFLCPEVPMIHITDHSPAYYLAILVANAIQPYAMNPTEWNLSGYTGFIWGSTSICVFIWGYFRLPETKDRSFEELDVMFAKRLPARQFKKYKPEVFVEAHTGKLEVKGDEA